MAFFSLFLDMGRAVRWNIHYWSGYGFLSHVTKRLSSCVCEVCELILGLRPSCINLYAKTVHLEIHYVLFQLVLGYE